MFEKLQNISLTLALGMSFCELPPLNTPSAYSNNMMHKPGVVISDIPHHVLVVYSNLYCSGSLISSKTVLTAASCLSLMKRDMKCNVKVGSNTITGMSQIIPVLEVKIHEYYQEVSRIDNDIALLYLRDHVNFGTNVKKVVLAGLDVALRSGITIAVAGWSISKTVQTLSNILWTEMVVMDDTDCKKVYGNLITISNYCAKQPIMGKSEQQEHHLTDNGGSALFNNLLVGVLSFGAAKKDHQYVAVFTNVSYFHRWIHINTERFFNKHCVESSEYYTDEVTEDGE